MIDRKDLVNKVKKLLSLSTSSNEHEAQLATYHASQLIERYQITETETALIDAIDNVVVTERYIVPDLNILKMYVVRIAKASAMLFDSEALFYDENDRTEIIFIGYQSDIYMSKITFEHLYRSWKLFCYRDLETEKNVNVPSYKKHHGQAYAMVIQNRILSISSERKKMVQLSSMKGRELIVLKDDAVKDKIESFTTGETKSEICPKKDKGWDAGILAGNLVALGGEIVEASKKYLTKELD